MCRNVGFTDEFAWLNRISGTDKNAEEHAKIYTFAKGNASSNGGYNCTMEVMKHCDIMYVKSCTMRAPAPCCSELAHMKGASYAV